MMCKTCNGHGLRFSGITGKVELCPTCEGNKYDAKSDWVLTCELDAVEGYSLEEHIKNLLERAGNAE